MALQTWRIFGITATVIIYIGGVLFLSMNNAPGSHPKRVRIERFAEFSNFRNARFPGAGNKMTIRWCTELKYLNTELPNRTAANAVATQRLHIENKLTGSTVKPVVEYRVTGLTALASFPGSGNTWLRYLLQQATGILTGSIYLDYGLLKTGFPGENVRDNSVLLVKTHESGPKAWEPFSRAILLVRDPEKAILAEFNRQSGGHVGFASPDRYKRTRGEYWNHFVTNGVNKWETTNLNWAREFTGNIKIVYYDDLVNDLENTLRGILNFLEFPINETLLHCALMRREGIFRRKKRILTFDPFTPAMHTMLQKKKRQVYNMLGRYD